MILSMALPTQLSRRPVLYLPPLLSASSAPATANRRQRRILAGTALERGDYSAAEAAYRNALRENPRSPELLTDLGITLQLQGRSTDAIDAFEQALKLKSMPRTYALLAEEKCKDRDLDGARPMVAKILAKDPLDLRNLALVAPCYLELDEPVEAVQAYSALLNDPEFPSDLAMIQLAKSYLLSAQFFSGRLAAAPGNAIYIQALEMRAIMPHPTHAVHSQKQSETHPISTPTYRSWMLSTFGVSIPTTQHYSICSACSAAKRAFAR